MPVGLISSEGFPNPNGMIIFAKALSYLPSLWSVSFVLSFIQFFLILILGYILFKNDNRFYLFILPIRPAKKVKDYKKIWMEEGSPLYVYTKRLLKKLNISKSKKDNISINIAMRYGEPNIKKQLKLSVTRT